MIVIIPARLQSQRFPGKMLASLAGEPLVIHTWRRAVEADIGPTWVACGDEEIYDVIKEQGGNAIMTPQKLASGTDRVAWAYEKLKASHDFIVDLQGDLPFIKRETLKSIALPAGDMGTLATCLRDGDLENAQVCKVDIDDFCCATNFSRKQGQYHHIGVYIFTENSLKKFTSLLPSYNEKVSSLEQWRALDNGMVIYVKQVDDCPIGVDTPEDLERCRLALNP